MQIVLLMTTVILLNVCGHVFLKIGMNQVGQMADRSLVQYAVDSISNLYVILGLAGYVSSVTGYIVVLSKTQLSVAYPILMSTGYALVVLVSFLFLKEPFNILKWFGIALIFIGVVFVSIKA